MLVDLFNLPGNYIISFQESSSTEQRIKTLKSALQSLVYEYVCRSLFKVRTKLDLFVLYLRFNITCLVLQLRVLFSV